MKEIFLKDSLGYSREEMPQIPPTMIGHFILWLKGRGVSVSELNEVHAYCVLPSQMSVNVARVDQKVMKGENDPSNLKTLILGSGGHQLDGHNTVQAFLKMGLPDKKIPCYRVRIPISELIEHAKEYEFTTYKTLEDLEV